MAGSIQSIKMEKQKLAPKQNQQDQSFLYKAVIVTIFLVILLLLPSQAPEFSNQSLLTRTWELLHLLLVGIAISYGLFSRRNNETEKENCSNSDNAHNVVSRFLQVSSFFEDEVQTQSDSDETETQVQTWSAQHHRNKPTLVVAPPQQSHFDHRNVTSLQSGEKPLLLPVRSLKSYVSGNEVVQSDNFVSTIACMDSHSNPPESIPLSQKSLPLGVASPIVNSSSNMKICCVSEHALISPTSETSSKTFSSNANKARIGEIEGGGNPKVEDKMKENAILPWRSSLMDQESKFSRMESRSVKSQKSHSSQKLRSSPKLSPSPSFSSPKELSPSPSFSSESLAKNAEDFTMKKGFYKPSPPPPPPPPPATFQKSISMKPRSSSMKKVASFDKELKPSFKSERNVPFRTDKLIRHASFTLVSEPASVEFSYKEKENLHDNMIMGSDEDTETEDEDVKKDNGEGSHLGESSKTDKPCNSDEGPDVDKKADEFIAKFREQIRLQRIDSIKRSARRILQGNFEDP